MIIFNLFSVCCHHISQIIQLILENLKVQFILEPLTFPNIAKMSKLMANNLWSSFTI